MTAYALALALAFQRDLWLHCFANSPACRIALHFSLALFPSAIPIFISVSLRLIRLDTVHSNVNKNGLVTLEKLQEPWQRSG